MTRALIRLPICSRERVSVEPVAPGSGTPSAYHCVVALAGCGAHAAGVSVRVVPTSGAPWIVGCWVAWKVPGATGAVARTAAPGVYPLSSAVTWAVRVLPLTSGVGT